MLRTMIIAVIMAAGLLGVCWMLVEYWLRSSGQIRNEAVSVLSVWGRMAYAFEHFCRVIRNPKNITTVQIEEEAGKVPLDEKLNPTEVQEIKSEKVKERGCMYRSKKYRLKEKM